MQVKEWSIFSNFSIIKMLNLLLSLFSCMSLYILWYFGKLYKVWTKLEYLHLWCFLRILSQNTCHCSVIEIKRRQYTVFFPIIIPLAADCQFQCWILFCLRNGGATIQNDKKKSLKLSQVGHKNQKSSRIYANTNLFARFYI